MKRIWILSFALFITLAGCDNDPSVYVDHLNGKWEIVAVKKNSKTIKEYNINSSIDYFEVQDDLTGFRKKLMPNLDGKYIITEHEAPFKLLIENGELQIHYHLVSDTIVETIQKATESELIIKNDHGFTYFYKPFEPFNLGNE
jgi:hypothetical protein